MLDDVRGQLAELLRADEAGCVFVPNATVRHGHGPRGARAIAAGRRRGPDHRSPLRRGRRAARSARGNRRHHHRVSRTFRSTLAHARTSWRRSPTASRRARSCWSSMRSPQPAGSCSRSPRSSRRLTNAECRCWSTRPTRRVRWTSTSRATDADFWVGNLHKWICSPRAAAILSIAPQWRDTVRPLVASHHFAGGLQPAFDWTGTFDPVTMLAVPAALAFWAERGWDNVRKRSARPSTTALPGSRRRSARPRPSPTSSAPRCASSSCRPP